jgi:hypothetical protein
MAARRPIYRKEKPRSVSKTGLMLCLLLAGGVMLVPLGGDVAHVAKMKVRDLALSSGLVDLSDCVVTPDHALACSSHALGTPLPVALRQIEDSQAQAAAEKKQRQRAESTVRELALEVQRLNAQMRQAQIAARAGAFFPPLGGEVRPTGLTSAGETTGNTDSSFTNTAAEPQFDEPFTPPQDAPAENESSADDLQKNDNR